MRTSKKISILVCLALCFVALLALTSCFGGGGSTEGEHVHTEEIIPGVEATCTEDGLTEGKKCSDCGEILVAQTIIPESHEFENSYVCVFCEREVYKESQGLEYSIGDDETYYAVVGIGDCTDTDVIVPFTYEGLPVKEIRGDLLRGCDSIINVVVPNSVIKITGWAFSFCNSLKSVTIGSGTTTIDDYAFAYNDTIERITVSAKNKAYKSINGDLYTKDGSTLIKYSCGKEGTLFVIPNGVITIADNAFHECKNLKTLIIPEGVTTIGNDAFLEANIENIEIPNSITTVKGAFLNCPVKSTKYSNAEYLGNKENPYLVLFHGWNTTSCEVHPNTKVIADEAFYGCDELTAVVMHDGVKSIGENAFRGCILLTSVTIPSSVTFIGEHTFYDCQIPWDDGHKHFEQEIMPIPPTCMQDGRVGGSFCLVCNKTLVEPEIIKGDHIAKIHKGTPPTCEYPGSTDWQSCDYCGTTIVEWKTIDALGHKMEIIPSVNPTCTESGLSEGKKCANCNEIFREQEVIPPKGHYVMAINGVSPTCTEPGLSDGEKCIRCGEITKEQKELEPLGHKKRTYEASEPTCTQYGCTEIIVCEYCGEVFVEGELIMPTGHTEEIIPAVAPTCTKNGLFEGLKCSVCGEILERQETDYAVGHTEKTISAVEPTCEKTGLTEGVQCSVCNEVLVKQEVVPKRHRFENSYTCTVCGYEFYKPSEGLEFELSSDKTYYIVSDIGTCKDTDIVIPYTHEGLPVEQIGGAAFYNRDSITSIVIPNCITSIGNNAFANCNALESINVDADNAKYLSIDGNLYSKNGEYLIQYAIGKKDAEFEIPYGVITIYENAFSDSEFITSVKIPSSTSVIGNNAFRNCKALTSVDIPSGLKTIGAYAFALCESLECVTIPNSVTTVQDGAFSSCYSLSSVEMENGVKMINDGVFRDCTSLTSVRIPESVWRIYSNTFWGCNSLTIYCEAENEPSSFNAGWNNINAVTKAPVVWNCDNNDVADDGAIYTVIDGIRYALDYRSATVVKQPTCVKKAIIPNSITYNGKSYSVTEISDYAFKECASLTSVVIGDGVQTVGFQSFFGCDLLTIYCEASSKPSGWSASWNYSNRPVVWGHTHSYTE